MPSITLQITKRIQAKKRGWVFTPKDFADIGPRTAMDQVLSRLTKQGVIRRLDRGVYDYPRQHTLLGMLSPDTDRLAQAIAAKSGDTLFPSGAAAANMLGISTQVPAKAAYLTDGPSRTYTIGGRTILLKHARVPLLTHLSHTTNTILQALAYLGKENMDDQVLSRCASHLTDQDIRQLVKATSRLPSWMADSILRMQQIKNGSLLMQA